MSFCWIADVLVALQLLSFIERITKELFSQFGFFVVSSDEQTQ